jgi:hypothetical protein
MSELQFIAAFSLYATALLLLAAAIGKTRSFSLFHNNLVSSFGISAWLSPAIAALLVTLEFFLAGWLFFSTTAVATAMTVVLLMLSAFSLMLLWRYLLDGNVKCSCFGEQNRPVSAFDLIRNLLILLTICLYFFAPATVLTPGSLWFWLVLSIAAVWVLMLVHCPEILSLLCSEK